MSKPQSKDSNQIDIQSLGSSHSETNVETKSETKVTDNVLAIIHERAEHDVNFQYIRDFDVESHAAEETSYPKVVRKLYKQFAFIMTIIYFLQFLDKVSLNYANIMGLQLELGLVGNQFSQLPTYFFVAYIFGEFGQTLLIQRFPVSKVLGANVVLWGILTACCAATTNFAGIMAVRVLLGLAESAVVPCMVLLTTNFVDKSDTAMFTGIWYSGLGFGQIFGGLISFGFQHVSLNASVSGWKIMFIVIGFLNIISGVYVFFLLPSTPLTNKNLTPKEKYVLLVKLSEAKIGVELHAKFSFKQAKEYLFDIQSLMFLLISATISFSSNTISTFSAVDIMSFGFTSKQAALLNMPSGVVSIVTSWVSTFFIRKGFPRFLAISILLVPAVIGGGLMSYLPKTNQAGLLVGIYMINSVTAPLAICYAWAAANVSGSTKKVLVTAGSISIGFALGNITGPQSYKVKDAPYYGPAKVSMLVTQAVSIVLALLMAGIYYMRNKSRKELIEKTPETAEDTWADLTDFENKTFRYSY